MIYTVDPELTTDIPLIAQLAQGMLVQFEASSQDKTFRKRLLQILQDNKPIKIGKVKAISVSFYAYKGISEDGLTSFETAYSKDIPENFTTLEATFDLSVRVAQDFSQPVVQVSIPLQKVP